MKIECAKCKKDLGEKEPLEDKTVTHGLCQKCASEWREEIDREAEEAGMFLYWPDR